MKIKMTDEIREWLWENAYAELNHNYWLLGDFPKHRIPDGIYIPFDKKIWSSLLKEGRNES